MPYADPKKKGDYMARYNSEYDDKKREDIIPRVNKNKNKLRGEKKEWCLHSTTGQCYYCSQNNPEYLLVRSLNRVLLPTPVCDQSWDTLKTHPEHLEIICTVCDRDRRRKPPKV